MDLDGALRAVAVPERADFESDVQDVPDVPEVTWRGLRHTCLTLMAATQPIHVVQRWAGHSDLKTTQIYLHAQEDDLVAAAESVL